MAAKTPDFRKSTAAMFLSMKDNFAKDPAEVSGEVVRNIPISEISDFPDHPFKVRQDEAMMNMMESIRENGVRQPAIIRPLPDGSYQMLSGHRRKAACTAIGLETIPAVVRDMNDDEAIICMVESNHQRENILPSERAFSYKMQLEAENRQGKRNDLTSTPLGSKLRTNEKVGEKNGDSREQVRRYVRLTELITPLLEMVDDKRIAFRPAVELSYLPKELQSELLDVIAAEECTPSLSQAMRMKQAAQEGKLDRNGMELVMREEKPQQNNITIKGKKLDKYFPKDFTPAQKEERIIKALDLYCRRLERMKQEQDYAR